MKQKKGSKSAIGIIIGLLVGVITVIAIIFIFILLFFFGGPPEVTKNVNKYEQTMEKNMTREYGKARTEFLTFPEKIPQSAFEQDEKPQFYNFFQDTFDDPTYEVYLKCKYNDDDYKDEIDRLKAEEETYSSYDNRKQKLLFIDSDRFSHPVYIAIDHNDCSYEYAMDLGDDSIAYIYTAYKFTKHSLKKIPEEYLPADYENSLTLENGSYFNLYDENTTAYNIYMMPKYEGKTTVHGLSAYNKEELENSIYDISGLLLFPDDINSVENGNFEYIRDSTFGYIILEAVYSNEDYKAEEERLQYKEDKLTTYDTKDYNYPAYVCLDGVESINDEVRPDKYKLYEYALMDEENNKIIYIYLMNPGFDKLQQYSDYLANDVR